MRLVISEKLHQLQEHTVMWALAKLFLISSNKPNRHEAI
jgi:hypothetical protein